VRIEKLQENFDVKIKWIHFPLHPDTPMEGRTMEELFAGRNIDLKANYETMKARMDAEGLEYGQRTHSYNSRLAQELGKWADTQPGGEAIHNALYRAYFIDNNNLADIDVLVAVAESVGLSGDAARQVLDSRSFEAEIDADWAKSREYGVTGVPTFVAGGYGVVGAQPYEALEGLMKQVAADAEQNGNTGNK
jgi:predicted DsbA family dithiol-disulfide isomerase